MKILTLNIEFPPLGGGASPVSSEIASGLVQQGHEVTVLTMGYPGLEATEIVHGIHVIRVWAGRRKLHVSNPLEHLIFVFTARSRLKKLVKEKSFDICHVHFLIPTGIIARWLCRRYQLPFVVTAHGSDVPGFNPDRFKLLHRFTRPLLKQIAASASQITTPSEYLAELIQSSVSDKIAPVVIPNGARDMQVPSVPKERVIMSAGRILKRKGFHLLVDAFVRDVDESWRLIIVGDGPYMSEVVQRAAGHPRIEFTGWIDNTGAEFKQLLNKSALFALLSSQESQGIVFIEAMSASCALLSADSTACAETVTKESGWFADINDTASVSSAIIAATQNYGAVLSKGQNARTRYLSNYSYKRIVPQYEQLFSNVLST